MRSLCASLALGVGLLGLVPESAEACHRRGGSVVYSSAPAAYGYPHPAYYPPGAPGYYAPGAYLAPPAFYPPQRYALQPPAPHQSFYPPSVTPTAPTTNATVALYDDRFEPATITVAPGATVRWTNRGAHKHTVTSATGGWDSGDLAPGQLYSATFTRPGTYEYFCRHHKDMKGTIIVK